MSGNGLGLVLYLNGELVDDLLLYIVRWPKPCGIFFCKNWFVMGYAS